MARSMHDGKPCVKTRIITRVSLTDLDCCQTDLDGQFIIGDATWVKPSSWTSSTFGTFVISHDPKLPVFLLKDETGPIALFIGWPIHPELGLMSKTVELTDSRQDVKSTEGFESFIDRLSGRFVSIYSGRGGSRFYLDASGSLSAVYSPFHKIVASTPSLIPISPETKIDKVITDAFGIPYDNAWYPFGITNRIGIHRLLPNHFLDLQTWNPVRHWPKKPLGEIIDIDSAVEEIVSIIKQVISESIAASGVGLLGLTAGMDSRMLLACAREEISNIRVFTAECDWSGYFGRVDIDTARHITKKIGIDHTILPFQRPTAKDYQKWVYRTGSCVGEIFGLRNFRTMSQLDDMPGAYLCAVTGEAARGVFWKEGDLEKHDIELSELLERLNHLPAIERVIEAGSVWRQGLPHNTVLQLLDFAYLEQKIGCWGGVANYADAPLKRVHPFCNRRMFELMMGLPAEYRFRQGFAESVIRMEWPELLAIPFNEPVSVKMKCWKALEDQKRRSRQVLSRVMAQTPVLWRFNPGRHTLVKNFISEV